MHLLNNIKTWRERMHPEGYYAEGDLVRTGWTAVTAARDAEIADLRAEVERLRAEKEKA